MRVSLTAALLAQLRRVREAQTLPSVVEQELDAFRIHVGLGPDSYLTADGRLLDDHADLDGPRDLREASDATAIGGLVLLAQQARLPELLDLLPSPPPDAAVCARCQGTRWAKLVEVPGFDGPRGICVVCHGLGWTPPGARAR
jgi:hypothetical protein